MVKLKAHSSPYIHMLKVLACSFFTSDGCEVFCDLSSDPTLFVGQGDYQFEIYRLMKDENQ